MPFQPRPRLHRALMLALCGGAVTLSAIPAQAIPLLGVGASAGAYTGALTGARSGISFELEGSAEVLGLDAAGTLLGKLGGTDNLIEVGLRKEISFIPMLSVKPTLGYQGQSFFTGKWDQSPMARLDLGFSPILSPIWFDGSLGVSYPVGLGRPIGSVMVGGNFALLPLASIGVRYRSYRDLSGATSGTSDFGAVEVGLRLTI